jgi:hypothetical protein
MQYKKHDSFWFGNLGGVDGFAVKAEDEVKHTAAKLVIAGVE